MGKITLLKKSNKNNNIRALLVIKLSFLNIYLKKTHKFFKESDIKENDVEYYVEIELSNDELNKIPFILNKIIK